MIFTEEELGRKGAGKEAQQGKKVESEEQFGWQMTCSHLRRGQQAVRDSDGGGRSLKR